MAIDVRTRRSKLSKPTGGLSGPLCHPIAVRMVWEAENAVDIPVCGVGGVMTGERGVKVILDVTFPALPHQVRGAARSAARAGADLLSVHGMGSGAMLAACREGAEAAAEVRGDRPNLVAITVLTSMSQDSLSEIGVESPVADEAARLASLARANGVDGIVCSPMEAASMRELLGPDALIVTPGVRPAGADLGDQTRVATPAQAIQRGASHIVVGRPITGLGPDALIVTPGVRPAGADLGDQTRVATPAQAIQRGASHIVVGRPITGADDPVAAYESIVSELVKGVE